MYVSKFIFRCGFRLNLFNELIFKDSEIFNWLVNFIFLLKFCANYWLIFLFITWTLNFFTMQTIFNCHINLYIAALILILAHFKIIWFYQWIIHAILSLIYFLNNFSLFLVFFLDQILFFLRIYLLRRNAFFWSEISPIQIISFSTNHIELTHFFIKFG